jgi:hypothetical protein
MGGVFDPRVFSAETHDVGGETDGKPEEREARERANTSEDLAGAALKLLARRGVAGSKEAREDLQGVDPEELEVAIKEDDARHDARER